MVVIDELACYSATVGTEQTREAFAVAVRDLVVRGRAAAITPDDQGVGLLLAEGGGPRRLRAAHLSDAQVHRIADTPPRAALPTASPAARHERSSCGLRDEAVSPPAGVAGGETWPVPPGGKAARRVPHPDTPTRFPTVRVTAHRVVTGGAW